VLEDVPLAGEPDRPLDDQVVDGHRPHERERVVRLLPEPLGRLREHLV